MKKVEGTSDSLIEAASVICGQLNARAVFVHADAMKDLGFHNSGRFLSLSK